MCKPTYLARLSNTFGPTNREPCHWDCKGLLLLRHRIALRAAEECHRSRVIAPTVDKAGLKRLQEQLVSNAYRGECVMLTRLR